LGKIRENYDRQPLKIRIIAGVWGFTARFESSIIEGNFRAKPMFADQGPGKGMLGMFACMNMEAEESPAHNNINNLKEVNIPWHII